MQIIILTYNRPTSLMRLIDSLKSALGENDANLMLSLEYGSDAKTKDYVASLDWSFGLKTIVENSEPLGTHKHMISCLKRAEAFSDVLVLEDDHFIVKGFIKFLKYGKGIMEADKRISGISLHHYEMMQDQLLPFKPLANGEPAYLLQKASANGFWMNNALLKDLNNWIEAFSSTEYSRAVPNYLKKWGDKKWSTLIGKYLIEKNMYQLYPRISYVTDFGEKGENYNRPEQKFGAQSDLFYSDTLQYDVNSKKELVAYDAWYEIDSEYLKSHNSDLESFDFCNNLQGQKSLDQIQQELILTTENTNQNSSIVSFSKELKPLENNILHGLKGHGISLVNKNDIVPAKGIETLIQNYEKQLYFNSKHSVVQGFKNTLAKWFKRLRK
jgi:hypothetical protein